MKKIYQGVIFKCFFVSPSDIITESDSIPGASSQGGGNGETFDPAENDIQWTD